MKYKVTLNNKVYEVEVEHGEAIIAAEYDAMTPVPAAPAATAAPAVPAAPAAPAAGEAVTSPLPGNVLTIKVDPGQSVKKGDLLMLIEAMKMENEIVAPRDGVIAQIPVRTGMAVNTGDTLAVLG